ncbi:MAG TPA: ATP-binding cassette domain-containing protein, partial [Planctomycetota bacterium]|nr:ATP-binding cassette domain-containing protein [Planctomycetota bacterium]
MDSHAALVATGIARSFVAVKALSRAELTVRSGSIHALVGENGAGKSTLISIISGLLRPDAGTLQVHGQRAEFRSPLDAVAAGIGTVHQHFMLAEALTVAENIALGMRRSAGGLNFRRREIEDEVARLSESTGLHVDPRSRVGDLAVGLRQRVEILKALSRGARILLLDEPTAVLAPPEIEKLFDNLRRMRDGGRTIVIVTHKLDEVTALASDVTVLRRGETVFAGPLAGMTPAQIAEKMIGREAPRLAVAAPSIQQAQPPTLEIENLRGAVNVPRLRILGGEILGIAGVEGNGQQELAEAIIGTRTLSPGDVNVLSMGGSSIRALTPAQRAELGLACIPADRQREGLVLEFSLTENLHLRAPLQKGPLLDHARMKAHAAKLLPEYDVRPPDPELPAEALSGG